MKKILVMIALLTIISCGDNIKKLSGRSNKNSNVNNKELEALGASSQDPLNPRKASSSPSIEDLKKEIITLKNEDCQELSRGNLFNLKSNILNILNLEEPLITGIITGNDYSNICGDFLTFFNDFYLTFLRDYLENQDNSANGNKDYVRFENGKLVYSDNLNDLTKKLNSDFATFHDDFNEFHESSQMYDFIKEFHNFLLKLAKTKSSMEDQSTPKILGIIEKVSKITGLEIPIYTGHLQSFINFNFNKVTDFDSLKEQYGHLTQDLEKLKELNQLRQEFKKEEA